MPVAMFHDRHSRDVKRDVLHWNFGGQEQSNVIQGNNNHFTATHASKTQSDETLLRKAGAQLGRVIEGGTDLVISPAKWLGYMQENW